MVMSYFIENKRFVELIDDYEGESDLRDIANALSDSLYEYKINNTYNALQTKDSVFLCKYSRMLNLEAKIAHTSRMLYMTEKAFKDIKNPILIELVKLSVIFHDIGRFYQAVYYPDFFDRRVSDVEQSKLLDNHGKVGYYFSIQKLIAEDLIKCNAEMDEVLLIHTLMSTVIKLHQGANSQMVQYDVDYSDCNVDNDTIKQLIPVLKDVYKNGKIVDISPKYRVADNIKFMEGFNIETIVNIVKYISTISEYEKYPQIHDEAHEKMKNRIDRFLRQFFSKERLEELYNNPSLLTEVGYLEEMFGVELPKDLVLKLNPSDNNIEEYVSLSFKKIESELLDRDFANEIDKIMKGENTNIPSNLLETIKQLMGAAMTITTDADKLDIFNQRINGSWEKTNGSVYKRKETAIGELTKEEVVDDYCRSVFFSKYGEEPDLVPGDPRGRGYKISGVGNANLGIKPTGNKIKALWFHIDQFITINLRNYRSFEYLKDNNILDKVRNQIISVQEVKGRELEILTSLINEPIEFAKMFIDNILKSRIDDNGNIIFNGDGKIPTLFTQTQIATIRNKTVEDFKMKFDYVGDKPREVDNQLDIFVNIR